MQFRLQVAGLNRLQVVSGPTSEGEGLCEAKTALPMYSSHEVHHTSFSFQLHEKILNNRFPAHSTYQLLLGLLCASENKLLRSIPIAAAVDKVL